jgi:hypothetical protein
MTAQFTVYPRAAFRAHRDYYHSTDLYEALVQSLRDHGVQATAFDLRIRERIVNQPRIDFVRGEAAATGELAAMARFGQGATSWTAHVSSGSEPIADRKPYDEGPIWSRVEQFDNCLVAQDCVGVAPIEVVTAVAVLAHRKLLPPPPGARWLLAQISADRLLGEAELGYFKLELTRRLGPTMTQSRMVGREGAFGKMLFILK